MKSIAALIMAFALSASAQTNNQAPVADAQTVTLDEDTPAPVTLTATDPENAPLTWTVITTPAHGTLSGTAPDLIYTPDTDWHGADSFSFSANDGELTSDPAVVTIEVAPVNDAPVPDWQILTGEEDTAVSITLTATDAEGDEITFTVTNPPSFGTLSGTPPNLIYTPGPNWYGFDLFAFTASDGSETSNVFPILLDITSVNDAPEAIPASFVTDEDTVLDLFFYRSDPEGDWVTFTVTTPPAHGTLSGEFPMTYTPDANYSGPDSFEFTASDGVSTSAPATASLTVTPVNDPPEPVSQSLTLDEDTPLPITLTATDVEGDPLTYTIIASPMAGTLTGTPPNLIYTPLPNWNSQWLGEDSFSFIASDSETSSYSWGLVTLTVASVNDEPFATAQTLTGTEDTPLDLQLTGTDNDDQLLSFEVTDSPSHGTLSGTGRNLTYTPDGNWHGTDSFAFTATDGIVTSAPAEITLVISAVNDAPVPAAQSLPGTEDTALPVVLTATDADGDTLTFAVTLPPSHGTLSGTAPDLIYTPDAGWHGLDSFEFTVSDASETSPPVEVILEIAPVNDAPVAAAASIVTGEDTATGIVLTATDAENDPLTYTVTVPPAHGNLSGTTPNLTYTPGANFAGSDSFEFAAADASFTSAPATVSITITPVNDLPVAASQSLAVDEDAPLSITLTAVDVEGEELTFAITTPPAHGTLSGTAPNLIYTPAANFHGAESFAFAASDGTGPGAPAVVSIAVAAVNDAPLAAAQLLSCDEDTALPVTLTGTDADGDPLAFVITALPANGTLNGTIPNLTYTPNANWHGTDSFSFTVTDGPAVSALASVAIVVAPVNDKPAAAAQSLTGSEDSGIAVALAATDADGDALTFTVTLQPAHGTLSGTVPNLTYTPAPDWHGLDSFSFTASDASEISVPVAVTLEILPVNDVPLATAGSVATNEDTPVAVILTGTDTEGTALTFAVSASPAHGALSGTAPNLTYTPAANYHGADSFTFTVSDGEFTSGPAAISISVAPLNDEPVASGQALAVNEDNALPLTLTATDLDGDSLTYSTTTPPAHGSLSGTAPNVTYTPAANYHGADSFTFTASDGSASSSATISITVNAVNDAPVANALAANTEVATPVSFTLTGSDVEGSLLTWNVSSAPAFGTLSGTAPSLTFTPNLAWSGVDSFTFTVSDGTLVSAPGTVTLTAASSGPWQLVVRTGHVVPGAGGAAVSSIAADYVSDAAGRASFRATAGAVTGIWTEDNAGLAPALVQGGAAPGVSGAVFDAVTTGPWAAGDGELLLFGKMLTGTGGVTSSSDLGYWLRNAGATMLTARENNAVPSLPPAARFSVLSGVATLGAGGNYAFAASLQTNSSLGITSTNDTGVWGTFGVPQRLIVRENDAAPGGGGGLFDTFTSAALTSNGDGQLAFSTAMKVAGSITTANRYGLWLWDPLQFGLVARGAHQAPGTPAGARFAQPQQPSLGATLGFTSTLATGAGSVNSNNDTGIWVLESGTVSLAAREGSQAPGIAAGGVFDPITDPVVVSSDGGLTFRASLRNGGGVSSANNAGVWSRSPFTGNVLTIVARRGSAAPGAGTATFSAFDIPFIANDGSEAFTATLTTGAGGVTTANDRGLWGRSAAGPLVLVLREGQSFTLAPGDTRTVSAITLPAAQISGRTPFSDEGRVLMLITFTNGSSALYHYTLP